MAAVCDSLAVPSDKVRRHNAHLAAIVMEVCLTLRTAVYHLLTRRCLLVLVLLLHAAAALATSVLPTGQLEPLVPGRRLLKHLLKPLSLAGLTVRSGMRQRPLYSYSMQAIPHGAVG